MQESEDSQIIKTQPELTVELIVFIAYVINCTDQVKHKTEKIKIKGAEKFVGLKDVSRECISKKLEIEGKQEGSGSIKIKIWYIYTV